MPLTIKRAVKVNRWQLFNNPWNPNTTNLLQQSAIRESLSEFGQVADLIAWPHPRPYPALPPHQATAPLFQVIDGEHRLHEFQPQDVVFVTVLDGLTADQAKRLTLALDYSRGQPDPLKLTQLLIDLQKEVGPAQSFQATPFNQAHLDRLLKHTQPSGARSQRSPHVSPTPTAQSLEQWTRRTARYPSGAAVIINQAIERINQIRPLNSDPEVALGQALEFLAAEFLNDPNSIAQI